MRDKDNLSEIVRQMYAVNLMVILFYCLVTTLTTYRICRYFKAYEFLTTVGSMPMKPWRMPMLSVSLFLSLIYVSVYKNSWKDENSGPRLLSCIAEILLCVGVIESLNYYYSGIALVVLADLVNYIWDKRMRSLLMTILILLFVIGRYEILPFAASRIAFSSYLSYYSQPTRGFLSGAESVLVSVNTLLFVYYMVQLFTSQKEENERIKSLYEQIIAANKKLKEYALEMERMTEIRERNRFAREIHDTLGHTLTGIIMGSEASLALFDKKPEEARKRLEAVTQSARDGLDDVRASIKALRPDALEKHGLEQALREMITKFQKATSVTVMYEQQAGKLEFAADEEDTLYRIIQECMTNAVRHGKANFVHITLKRFGDILTIDIRDNGSGCEEVTEGFGLRHMQERLDLLSGSLTYGNRADDPDDRQKGFYVIASLPVRKKEVSEDDQGINR